MRGTQPNISELRLILSVHAAKDGPEIAVAFCIKLTAMMPARSTPADLAASRQESEKQCITRAATSPS
jgi:hypothetical protein